MVVQTRVNAHDSFFSFRMIKGERFKVSVMFFSISKIIILYIMLLINSSSFFSHLRFGKTNYFLGGVRSKFLCYFSSDFCAIISGNFYIIVEVVKRLKPTNEQYI